MKNKKLKLLVLTSLCVVIWLLVFMYTSETSNRKTSNQNQVFLSTSFGMSFKEVSDCLAIHQAKLLDAEHYLATSDVKHFELETSFIPLNYSWEKWEAFYMPSIILFESFAETSFSFEQGKLVDLSVQFSPISASKSQFLVEILDSEFKNKYVFENREESTNLPGAYTLIYRKNGVVVRLWVNLTNSKNPVIIAYIIDDLARIAREEKIKDIDSQVF